MSDSDPLAGSPLEGHELELEFPCAWTYTVIGTDEARVRAVVASTVQDAEYVLNFSHESKNGKYRSLQLEVQVRDDEERLRIFRVLHEHSDIAYVL